MKAFAGLAMPPRILAAVTALALGFGADRAAAQFAGHPSLISKNAAGEPANEGSGSVAVSADGRFTVFASDASNLVPLDENEDTDVFLYDDLTQILSRVSVNFQGEEATGDSTCPSISADGRFVAFASLAWNMAPGGTHVVDPVWDAYLLDRQGPQLMRLSRPIGGGLGSDHSGCPVVSADGTRVAFHSAAADLVPDDTNGARDVFVYDVASGVLSRASLTDDEQQADGDSTEPSISADGNVVVFTSNASNLTSAPPPLPWLPKQVYARDLAAGATELVSRRFGGPLALPSGESCCGQVSGDGDVVLFRSTAPDLVQGSSHARGRLYLRDREEGTTERVESLNMGEGPCGWPADPLYCDPSRTKGAALSGDGRFIAFLSSSFDLLPENPPGHRDQIFVQDRMTRRLRRVTVDETGYPTHSYPCGGSSGTLALSEDGGVLAFVGRDPSAFGLPATASSRDVIRLDLTCDPDRNGCRQISTCPGTPLETCEAADRSRLGIRRNPPLSFRRDRLSWRWVGPGDGFGQAFVDPDDAQYQLCVYAGETMHAEIDAAIPADGEWRQTTKNWRLKDRGAVNFLRLRTTSKRRTVKLTTTSPAIDLPYLPIDAPQGVRVQLQEITTGRCWEADFPESSLEVNRRGEIGGGGVTSGAVRAKLN